MITRQICIRTYLHSSKAHVFICNQHKRVCHCLNTMNAWNKSNEFISQLKEEDLNSPIHMTNFCSLAHSFATNFCSLALIFCNFLQFGTHFLQFFAVWHSHFLYLVYQQNSCNTIARLRWIMGTIEEFNFLSFSLFGSQNSCLTCFFFFFTRKPSKI